MQSREKPASLEREAAHQHAEVLDALRQERDPGERDRPTAHLRAGIPLPLEDLPAGVPQRLLIGVGVQRRVPLSEGRTVHQPVVLYPYNVASLAEGKPAHHAVLVDLMASVVRPGHGLPDALQAGVRCSGEVCAQVSSKGVRC